MKILAIAGTNQRKGNIIEIIHKIFEGVNKNHIQVELINLYDFNIKFCDGCWACKTLNKCKHNDDFEYIYQKYMEADIIILGSPVYRGSVSAIMKAFFDKFTSHGSARKINPKEIRAIKKAIKIKKFIQDLIKDIWSMIIPVNNPHVKKYIIVITATTVFSWIPYVNRDIKQTIDLMKTHIKKLKQKLIGSIIYSDTLYHFNSRKKDKILRKAFELGSCLDKKFF